MIPETEQKEFQEWIEDIGLKHANPDVIDCMRSAWFERARRVAEKELQTLQDRVLPWLNECFTQEIIDNVTERNDRFLEEALELVQSLGYSKDQAIAMVEYVFDREKGDPPQEVGGVMITLAALCIANNLDMHKNGETELTRIWKNVEKIRRKNAAKPRQYDNKDLF